MVNKTNKRKLYCYVDETGQDTKGKLFIVSVIITKEDRDEINKFLQEIETKRGKDKGNGKVLHENTRFPT